MTGFLFYKTPKQPAFASLLLLLKRQAEVAAQWGDKDNLFILLKAAPQASYKNLVDAIDEMKITKSQFTICDLNETDSTLFQLKITN